MPKLKTKKTLTKRVRVTVNGKMVVKQSSMGHLKSKRDASRRGRKKKRVVQPNRGHIITLSKMLGKGGKGVRKAV